jgi:cell wall-associated NlpC family hydrolase
VSERDEQMPATAEPVEASGRRGRGLTLGLLIGLVVCAILAVSVALYAQRQISSLEQQRDSAQRDNSRLLASSAASAANAAKVEQSLAAARAERDEFAQILVAVRQDPFPGKDIKDPALPLSIAGKRREALMAAFALKQEKVSFKWGGREKEEGLDSAGFAALALAKVGALEMPEGATAKVLQAQLALSTEGEPQPGDLLFFDGGNVLIYLGGDNAVGMLPEGPVTKSGVIKGKGIGFKYVGFGAVKYE